MDETITVEQLNKAVQLCEKRINTIKKLNELNLSLNKPKSVMTKREFNKRWFNEHVLTKVIFIISIIIDLIWLAVLIVMLSNVIAHPRNPMYYVPFQMMLLFGPPALAIPEIIILCIRRSAYNKYKNSSTGLPNEYQQINKEIIQLTNELNRLEVFMSFSENCIIPKPYWNRAIELMSIFSSNRSLTMEQAIKLLKTQKSI